MNTGNLPSCSCGTKLELHIGYTGADWDSEAGNGSGYEWEVSLVCPACGKCYTIGHIKRPEDFSRHLGAQEV